MATTMVNLRLLPRLKDIQDRGRSRDCINQAGKGLASPVFPNFRGRRQLVDQLCGKLTPQRSHLALPIRRCLGGIGSIVDRVLQVGEQLAPAIKRGMDSPRKSSGRPWLGLPVRQAHPQDPRVLEGWNIQIDRRLVDKATAERAETRIDGSGSQRFTQALGVGPPTRVLVFDGQNRQFGRRYLDSK